MVRFLNCFEVPTGRDEDFLAVFGRINAHMAAQPGYRAHRLHRSLAAEARFRFVNVVDWDTVEDWRAAHGPSFRALLGGPEWEGITSTPALYEVVHEGAR